MVSELHLKKLKKTNKQPQKPFLPQNRMPGCSKWRLGSDVKQPQRAPHLSTVHRVLHVVYLALWSEWIMNHNSHTRDITLPCWW